MKKILRSIEQIRVLRHVFKWTLLVIPVALITGSLVAAFLWLLDKATLIRWQAGWLLFLLPLAGIVIHFLYRLWGQAFRRR